jgi:phosphatidate cytidylyltransferase
LFTVIFLTEINDILQFIAGKSFGRKKIVPGISPNKTEAGFIGGLLGTTALATIILPKLVGFSPMVAAGLGLLIAFTGILGDLFFSAVKRYFDTKDFSDKIAGHGGYLDRLDSLIFTLPISYYYFWYTVGGFW